MLILGSNFDGVRSMLLVLGLLLILALVGLGSFFFSATGHWLGLILAAPCAIVGVLMMTMLRMVPSDKEWTILLLFYPVLLLIGLPSIAVWAIMFIVRRHKTFE